MTTVPDTTPEAPPVPGLSPLPHPLRELVKVDPAENLACCCNARPRVAVLVSLDNEHPILLCGHHAAKSAEKIASALAWRYV